MSLPTTNETTRAPEEVIETIASEDSGVSQNDNSPAGEESLFLLRAQIVESMITNRTQRIRYAKRTFWLTCVWIFLVILVVVASGLDLRLFGKVSRVLNLSDAVIITLITTTTLNVFGFFLLVMQYLFNNKELESMKGLFKSEN